MKAVEPSKLQGPKSFAASYSGEHVAGTEFVIGALFVSWGVGAYDVLVGLLIGNTLAVLTWGLITAPIATDTRLTLYAYLEKIAGPGTTKLYNVVNGTLFCILAGAMITVSASAVRIPFGIADQVDLLPNDIRFVFIVMGVGALVVYLAVKGFAKLSAFAAICAPWLIVMFITGALVMMPLIVDATPGVSSISNFSSFIVVAEQSIWIDRDGEIGFWHVAAFAWVANLAMHGALGDMSLLRFAKNAKYGYFSALGMFIGHYVAWICAGIMGAGTALLLQTQITEIDPGSVASTSLGLAGIFAVIIAGWTTSNPTIYRAGLAFSALNKNWNRKKVTFIVGIITTIVACSPFVFTELLNFVGFMGLLLSPIGAIIVAEHWIFPRIGLTRYWSRYQGNKTNLAAIITWVVAMIVGVAIEFLGLLHLFFILVPLWIFSTVMYIALARIAGAKNTYPQSRIEEGIEEKRKADEAAYIKSLTTTTIDTQQQIRSIFTKQSVMNTIAITSLVTCLILGICSIVYGATSIATDWLIIPTIIYFISAFNNASSPN